MKLKLMAPLDRKPEPKKKKKQARSSPAWNGNLSCLANLFLLENSSLLNNETSDQCKFET